MSGLLNYLILLLAAAFFSPHLIKKGGKAAPWLLGLVSAGGFGYLLSYAKFIAAGNTLNYTIEWLPELYLNFTLYLDGLSLFFGLLVTGMGALVLVFSG
ncbi:MAG: hypothetical protein WC271_16050, partial [Bacteroidales bacterium]